MIGPGRNAEVGFFRSRGQSLDLPSPVSICTILQAHWKGAEAFKVVAQWIFLSAFQIRGRLHFLPSLEFGGAM